MSPGGHEAHTVELFFEVQDVVLESVLRVTGQEGKGPFLLLQTSRAILEPAMSVGRYARAFLCEQEAGHAQTCGGGICNALS